MAAGSGIPEIKCYLNGVKVGMNRKICIMIVTWHAWKWNEQKRWPIVAHILKTSCPGKVPTDHNDRVENLIWYERVVVLYI